MQYPIADAHCDYLFGAMEYGYTIDTPKRDQTIALPALKTGGVALQSFACWSDTTLRTPPLLQVLTMIDRYHTMLDTHPEFVPFSASFRPDSGKIATFLTVEGAECCMGSPSILRDLYRLGVRAMAFTWNSDNELSGAAEGKRKRGLTASGRELLREMNRLHMAFDVSHLSDAGIDDALSVSTEPIYASHSNARARMQAPRCIRDEHIKEIANRGGVVGINFYGPQLVRGGVATIADIVAHILHVAEVGGIEACCIGSDFDGMTRYPKDLRNPSYLPALCRALEQAGLSRDEVYAIAYGNLARYLSRFTANA